MLRLVYESGNAQKWAKDLISVNNGDRKARHELLKKIVASITEFKDALNDISKKAAEIVDSEKSRHTFYKELQDIATGAADTELIQLLERAKDFMSIYHAISECPVCEQSVEFQALSDSIDDRLTRMNETRSILKKIEDAETILSKLWIELGSKEEVLIDKARNILSTCEGSTETAIVEKPIDFSAYHDLKNDDNEKFYDRLAAAKSIGEKLQPYKEILQTCETELHNDISQYTSVKISIDMIDKCDLEIEECVSLVALMSGIHGVIREERQSYIDEVLNEISSECNRLYSTLHPGEGLGNIRLTLDPKQASSLKQQVDFNGHSGKYPQAYYSESHLDTLGFCVWLSVAKKEGSSDSILVLDDILTSIDSAHMTRFINLLSEESLHFDQTIVTTHYRSWRNRYLIGNGGGKNVQLMELHRWTINRGIKLSNSTLSIHEIEQIILKSPLDRQNVSSKSGILLEAILDHFACQYGCRVPHKRDSDYTLGELWDACVKTLKNVSLETNGTKNPILPTIGPIQELKFIRNQVGCHFNLTGEEISDSDVENFANAGVAFAKAISCPSCGDIPSRKRDMHYICTCGSSKMTPIEKS